MTPTEAIEGRIMIVRSHRVLMDSDLALIYGVATKRLNQQVRRNVGRFPPDFAFALTARECRILRSHFATSRWGGRRTPPWVFTEHGALMLASVLSSPTAVQASIQVVRAFVRLRELLGDHEVLVRRLDELEARYDDRFKSVFSAIRLLMERTPDAEERRIGFHTDPAE